MIIPRNGPLQDMEPQNETNTYDGLWCHVRHCDGYRGTSSDIGTGPCLLRRQWQRVW